MKRSIKITPAAINDIQAAIDYYNKLQIGLGKRFSESIHTAFYKIQEMPQSASIAFDSIRYKVVNSFPFIITYEYDNQHIFILRIFNTHQHLDNL